MKITLKSFNPNNRKTKRNKSTGGMKKHAEISHEGKYRYELSRIRKIMKFAQSWGYGGVYVGNLYAFRSRDPKRLKHTDDPIGPKNKTHIQRLLGLTKKIIYAWGNNEKEPCWLRELVDTPYCIDISKKGVPKHPLYLKSDLQPKLYLRDKK